MPELTTPNYCHLLKPSIFCVSVKNIKTSIPLFEEYGIGPYVTNNCLRRNVTFQRHLLEYLVTNGIDLLVRKPDGTYRLNPILSASSTVLKQKYGIDIKTLQGKDEKKSGRNNRKIHQ